MGLSGRHSRNNRSSEGGARMRCSKWKWECDNFDVWAMIAAEACWVDGASLSWTCSFWSPKPTIMGNLEWKPGCKQEFHSWRTWWKGCFALLDWESWFYSGLVVTDWNNPSVTIQYWWGLKEELVICMWSAGSEWSRCVLQLSSFQLYPGGAVDGDLVVTGDVHPVKKKLKAMETRLV